MAKWQHIEYYAAKDGEGNTIAVIGKTARGWEVSATGPEQKRACSRRTAELMIAGDKTVEEVQAEAEAILRDLGWTNPEDGKSA